MSAKFESQNGSISDGPDDEALEQLLRSLDGAENSFASLTMPDGSYLQAGGGPDEFTVEVRLFPPGLPFRHLKAGMTGGLNNACEAPAFDRRRGCLGAIESGTRFLHCLSALPSLPAWSWS